MVDHRADNDQSLSFLVNAREDDGWPRAGLLQHLREWASDAFARRPAVRSDVHRHNDTPWSDWLRSNRLALALSCIWAGALVAYGVGYFARLGNVEGSASMLPTLDLVFFTFAILGPIAMIWFAVAMLNRATYLSDAITGQSESALALAATINNLNDSVDALSAGTTGRLEQACDRMEREASASVRTLDKSLTDTATKLETTLLDSVILMDSDIKKRMDRVTHALEDQQSRATQNLQQTIAAIQAAFDRESSEIGTMQRELVSRTDASLQEATLCLQTALNDLTSRQEAGLGAANEHIESAAQGLADDLNTKVQHHLTQIADALNSTQTELTTSASVTSATIRSELGGAFAELRKDVDHVRDSVAAHPPATAHDLAALMGEAVHRIISPEREALTQSVLRISALEEQVRTLLDRFDRTSRLMPHMDAAPALTPASIENAPDDTPLFGSLPQSPASADMNWNAVIHILRGAQPLPGTHEIVERTQSDPELKALIRLRDDILNALGERGLFAEDLAPEHCSAAIWHAWLRKDATLDTSELAGIRDEVSNAIARGWLRQDSANLSLSLRYLQIWQSILHRAVGEGCEDKHLVELTDTSAGRLFLLLGGLTGLFTTPNATH